MNDEFNRPPGPRFPARLAPIRRVEPIGPAAFETTAPEESDTHPAVHLRVLYRRRWTALSAFVIVMVTVCLNTFTATPMYEAKVQILIEKENSNVVEFKDAFDQNRITDDYYQTQYQILQTRALARRTIDALDLWNHPMLHARPDAGIRSLVAAPARMARALFARRRVVEPPPPAEPAGGSGVVDSFLANVTVVPVRSSRLVDVRYRSADPSFAALAANGLAKTYIEQNLEFRFLATKEASDWLGQRLGEQKEQVEASEQALQRYREQTGSVSLENRENIVVQKLADLNSAATKAKTERLLKEAAYEQIKAVQHDRNAIDTIPAILSNMFVQHQKTELAALQRQEAQLADTLGPNHPDMVKVAVAIRTAEAKIQSEIGKIVQAMRNDYQATLTQERSLASALEQQKLEALALNRKGIDYGALQRTATTNRDIFASLLQRTKETGISSELKTGNIRVVDMAEPPKTRVSPNTSSDLTRGFMAALALAVGLAFFFEHIDNRVKTPAEMKEHLRLPFLGMVPALFGQHAESPMISKAVDPGFVESFGAVRTNVLFSSVHEGGRSIAVTSTGPGEGKTVVAGNLAIALAQSGQRVLLVDGDLRKPRVHEMFTVPSKPGLSNVLVGTAKASESVRGSSVRGLWILPAGLLPPNPAELLGSKRFSDLIASLGLHFDWVVIDTPPVMAVTDASVIANLVTGVVFVVGAEMTSRHAAQRALEQLEQAHAKFIGAVLNRVNLKHNGYYYSQYYRHEYSAYYQSAS